MADEKTMTGEEIKKLLDEYKAQGLSDEDILDASYRIYEDGKIDRDTLKVIINTLGYDFSEEFLKAEEDGGLTPPPAEEDGEDGGDEVVDEKITDEDIEDAKEVNGPEDPEDEDSSDEVEEDVEDDEEEDVEDDESDDEDEKEKARNLFGLN